MVEKEADPETRGAYEAKVGYFKQRIALYRRFGLEQFAKTQADYQEKWQVQSRLKDLELFCERLSLSQLQEAELRELETKLIILLAFIVEGRCAVKMA